MDRTAADVVVTGRVQGVYFRAGLREQAEALGVAGWARNEPDGSVHAHLEGAGPDLDAVVAWCRQGTPAARVAGVERTVGEVTGATSFQVG